MLGLKLRIHMRIFKCTILTENFSRNNLITVSNDKLQPSKTGNLLSEKHERNKVQEIQFQFKLCNNFFN